MATVWKFHKEGDGGSIWSLFTSTMWLYFHLLRVCILCARPCVRACGRMLRLREAISTSCKYIPTIKYVSDIHISSVHGSLLSSNCKLVIISALLAHYHQLAWVQFRLWATFFFASEVASLNLPSMSKCVYNSHLWLFRSVSTDWFQLAIFLQYPLWSMLGPYPTFVRIQSPLTRGITLPYISMPSQKFLLAFLFFLVQIPNNTGGPGKLYKVQV